MEQESSVQFPQASRPEFPEGYGVPETEEGLLPWSYVEERMNASTNFWIGTNDSQGRPHATPVWGVWVDGTFYFDGSPETRRGRNMAANPNVVVHLEDGSKVVILQGEVHPASPPDSALGHKLAAAYAEKYKSQGYEPAPDSWNEGGLYRLIPRKAFAWTSFPTDTTRWRFPEQG